MLTRKPPLKAFATQLCVSFLIAVSLSSDCVSCNQDTSEASNSLPSLLGLDFKTSIAEVAKAYEARKETLHQQMPAADAREKDVLLEKLKVLEFGLLFSSKI